MREGKKSTETNNIHISARINRGDEIISDIQKKKNYLRIKKYFLSLSQHRRI